MKVTQVTFGRTKSHNYQSQRVDVTVELGAGDCFDEALAAAQVLVNEALGEGPTFAEVKNARRVLKLAEAGAKVRRAVRTGEL